MYGQVLKTRALKPSFKVGPTHLFSLQANANAIRYISLKCNLKLGTWVLYGSFIRIFQLLHIRFTQ